MTDHDMPNAATLWRALSELKATGWQPVRHLQDDTGDIDRSGYILLVLNRGHDYCAVDLIQGGVYEVSEPNERGQCWAVDMEDEDTRVYYDTAGHYKGERSLTVLRRGRR